MHRVVLQRPLELGNLGELGNRIGVLEVAKRLDHGAAKVVDAAGDVYQQGVTHLGIVADCRQRADERRTNEFAVFLLQRGEEAVESARDPAAARNSRTPLRAVDRSATPAPRSSAPPRVDR